MTSSRQNGSKNASADSSLYHEFSENGFVGPISLLSEQEAAKCLAKFEAWVEFFHEGNKLSGDSRFKPHLYLNFINQIVRHPKLVSAVKEVLKSENILCWSSDFNIKDPKSKGVYSPHQDATYTGLEPAERCVTAWVALSDFVYKPQGCLEFYKGSHKAGQIPHVADERGDDNLLSRHQRVEEIPESLELVPMMLRGGQASLHHFYTIHESGPNTSCDARVGLAIRYMDASVQQTGETRESVTLICGQMEHTGFDLEPILPVDPSEADVRLGREAHAEAMRRESANYFRDFKEARAYDDLLLKEHDTKDDITHFGHKSAHF